MDEEKFIKEEKPTIVLEKKPTVVEEIVEEVEERPDKEKDKGKEVKIYVNGTFKESVPRSTIIDLPLFVNDYAKNKAGIRNYRCSINGDQVDATSLKKKKIDSVNTIDIDTYDVARSLVRKYINRSRTISKEW